MIRDTESNFASAKREKQTRYLSQAIQLEEAVNPHIIKATMSMISMVIIVFLCWAGFTNINEVARAPGEVVPSGHQQIVQHLEGGIIKSINVSEGDMVEKGQVLIVLDDASIKEDLGRAMSTQLSLAAQSERLRAFLNGRNPDFSHLDGVSEGMRADQNSFFEGMRLARDKEAQIIRDQITQKTQSIKSLQTDIETARESLKIDRNMYEIRLGLNEKGYVSDMQVLSDKKIVQEREGEIKRLENQMLVAESEIVEFKGRLESLSAQHRDEVNESLNQVLTQMEQNSALIEKLKERIGRLAVKAPTAGLVQGLSVNTIGAVIQPGETVSEIVPLDKNLEISVKISPQDIGHLKVGQDVKVKFSTFDFSRYGFVNGRLEHISASTFSGEQGDRYYQGRVALSQNYVGNDSRNLIMPGMTVMTDVITGEKTILQYMLKPIHTSLKTAFTER